MAAVQLRPLRHHVIRDMIEAEGCSCRGIIGAHRVAVIPCGLMRPLFQIYVMLQYSL